MHDSPLRVLGYVRVSTGEQASGGVSLAAQRDKLALYCSLHGLDLAEVVEDAGVSAKTLDRPGLARALALLDRGEAVGIVVAKLDRLSRSIGDWQRLVDGYFGPAAGRHLFSVADSIDTRTAAGRIVLNIIMTIAQWEREAIAERTRDALAHKRRRGERTGGVPLGWVLAEDGRNLVPDPAEQEALALILRLRADGLGHLAICKELDRRKVPTKGGGPSWGTSSIRKILKRHRETTPCPLDPPPPDADAPPTDSA